jgi:hypothetical protein
MPGKKRHATGPGLCSLKRITGRESKFPAISGQFDRILQIAICPKKPDFNAII